MIIVMWIDGSKQEYANREKFESAIDRSSMIIKGNKIFAAKSKMKMKEVGTFKVK